jgi:glycosyltransferase involved in cell wall biosynthesis
MRRIALISEHASPLAPAGAIDNGGQNIYVAQVAKQFARRGCEVDVFTRRDRSLLPPIVHWIPGVRIIHVPAGPPKYVAKEDLLPMMKPFGDFLGEYFTSGKHRYDVVHANFFMSGMAAQPAAQATGIPLVITFHALGLVRRKYQAGTDRFPDERFAIERRLVNAADRIVAECPQDREDLLSLYDADPRRVSVVSCGVDPQEITPVDKKLARCELGWDRNEFIILQLGRLVPRKGIENVIRALAVLKACGHRARLYVVGGNSERPNPEATPEIGRLTTLAEALGVGQQVHFVGRRARGELSFYYSAADVFVTTPWYEPFGITTLEAMVCAKPVIGSAVGGIRSTVVHGVTGFLVPPEDPEALAGRLQQLWSSPTLRAQFGAAGRRRAMRIFTWDHVAAGLASVYEQAIGDRHPDNAAVHAAVTEEKRAEQQPRLSMPLWSV